MIIIIISMYFVCFRIQEPFALFDQLYDKPWMRLGPYLVGMAAGYLLFKTKCRIRIPCVSLNSISLALLHNYLMKERKETNNPTYISVH